MQIYIVETCENIPYDVTPFTFEKGMDYLQAIIDNVSKIKKVYSNENPEDPFAYVKWTGELNREYCATLINVYN